MDRFAVALLAACALIGAGLSSDLQVTLSMAPHPADQASPTSRAHCTRRPLMPSASMTLL